MAKPRQSTTSSRVAGKAAKFNPSTWYQQHEALTLHLLHMTVKALATPAGADDISNHAQDVDHAHSALRRHAQIIVGHAVPVVLARDGVRTIPFEQLAEAKAKVAALECELHILRATQPVAQERGQAAGSQAFAAGGQAMRADIVNMLSRRLAAFSAASRRFPAMAVRLGQAAGMLKVAKKEIEEIRS